jgi:ABC-type hemin transport system ATPase subunit
MEGPQSNSAIGSAALAASRSIGCSLVELGEQSVVAIAISLPVVLLVAYLIGQLARWLLRGCRILLLDEPTRGVDVGARAELYAVVRRLADEGLAVLLVSSEVPEVLGLADRVLVLREGRVVHTAPARELDEHRVLDLVMEGSPVDSVPSPAASAGSPVAGAGSPVTGEGSPAS